MERMMGGETRHLGGACGAFSASSPSRAHTTDLLQKRATLIVWVARVARFPIAYVVRGRTTSTDRKTGHNAPHATQVRWSP